MAAARARDPGGGTPVPRARAVGARSARERRTSGRLARHRFSLGKHKGGGLIDFPTRAYFAIAPRKTVGRAGEGMACAGRDRRNVPDAAADRTGATDDPQSIPDTVCDMAQSRFGGGAMFFFRRDDPGFATKTKPAGIAGQKEGTAAAGDAAWPVQPEQRSAVLGQRKHRGGWPEAAVRTRRAA